MDPSAPPDLLAVSTDHDSIARVRAQEAQKLTREAKALSMQSFGRFEAIQPDRSGVESKRPKAPKQAARVTLRTIDAKRMREPFRLSEEHAPTDAPTAG